MSLVARKRLLAELAKPLSLQVTGQLELLPSLALGQAPKVTLAVLFRYGDLQWSLANFSKDVGVVEFEAKLDQRVFERTRTLAADLLSLIWRSSGVIETLDAHVAATWEWLDFLSVEGVLEQFFQFPHHLKISDDLRALRDRWLIQSQDRQDLVIPGLEAKIRLLPHQCAGVRVLQSWYQSGTGGILADDMGLGKTLQSLALLALEKVWFEGPVLLVCPTALLENWASEAKKFFPELKVLVLHGKQRRHERWRADKSQVVIVSYGVLRRDRDWFQEKTWSACLADEAHVAKNPKSGIYKALCQVQARWKLALTGTPVQNRPAELHALLTWLHGPRWGEAAQFSEQWNAKPEWRIRICQMFLRRLKQDVLPDLPTLTTHQVALELGPQQKLSYLECLEKRDQVIARIELMGLSRGAVTLLAMLQKLRHVCNGTEDECAKWPFVLGRLRDAEAQGRKVLLFAQSRKLMDRLEQSCSTLDLDVYRIDGRTTMTQRSQQMHAFQNKKGAAVFLLSTRAAGVGLNLTAATEVLFWEHDWNPSWDVQARDRAHRIGQTQPVAVYRLVAKGTFEEVLLRRSEQKRQMAEAMLGGESLLHWSLEEIRELLGDLGGDTSEEHLVA